MSYFVLRRADLRQTPAIDYDHSRNRHSAAGAEKGFRVIESLLRPRSILDVGCGTGTWLRAAIQCGITDVLGIDGVDIADPQLLIPRNNFQIVDLADDWDMGRRFDVALCLEVAEHLDESQGIRLIANLTTHADSVVFSAAIPGQPGQHHINCQWPGYWQRLFNERGFACEDSIRWKLWDDSVVEPWYRQNCMICKRNLALAGNERRIHPVVHPDVLAYICNMRSRLAFNDHICAIESGALPAQWYVLTPFHALAVKFGRAFRALIRHNGVGCRR